MICTPFKQYKKHNMDDQQAKITEKRKLEDNEEEGKLEMKTKTDVEEVKEDPETEAEVVDYKVLSAEFDKRILQQLITWLTRLYIGYMA